MSRLALWAASKMKGDQGASPNISKVAQLGSPSQLRRANAIYQDYIAVDLGARPCRKLKVSAPTSTMAEF